MGFLSDKPYTAVTSTIERLTSEDFDIDDVAEIVELVDIIKIQWTGPIEAARAIRKKLKYGNVHRQLRALTNGGRALTPLYNDDRLIERLRFMLQDPMIDTKVRKRTQSIVIGWSRELAGQSDYARLTALYKSIPQRKKSSPPSVRRPDDYDGVHSRGPEHDRNPNDDHHRERHEHDRDRSSAYGTSTSSSRSTSSPAATRDVSSSKHRRRRSSASAINPVKEAPKIKEVLADSGTTATNLKNSLQHINLEQELATDSPKATEYFNQAKALRHKVLRYIHSITTEEFVGPLIHANEELVSALRMYEKMSKLPEEDDIDSEPTNSDSDSDLNARSRSRPTSSTSSPTSGGRSKSPQNIDHQFRRMALNETERARYSSQSPPPRPRSRPPSLTPKPLRSTPSPVKEAQEDENTTPRKAKSDDPFADDNEVSQTPLHTPMW